MFCVHNGIQPICSHQWQVFKALSVLNVGTHCRANNVMDQKLCEECYSRRLYTLPRKSGTAVLQFWNTRYKNAQCLIKFFVLRTRTEMVLETSVLSTFNHLTRLEARENFIKFSRRESLKSYTLNVFDIFHNCSQTVTSKQQSYSTNSLPKSKQGALTS
jgi:hypothetical protein